MFPEVQKGDTDLSVFKLRKINCCSLRDMIRFVQFKKREKHPWRSVTFGKLATLLKVILLHGHFSRFLNGTNGSKLCKASQINFGMFS